MAKCPFINPDYHLRDPAHPKRQVLEKKFVKLFKTERGTFMDCYRRYFSKADFLTTKYHKARTGTKIKAQLGKQKDKAQLQLRILDDMLEGMK